MNKMFYYFNETYGFPTFVYIGNDRAVMEKEVSKKPLIWDKHDFHKFLEDMEPTSNSTGGVTTTLRTDEGCFVAFVWIPEYEGISGHEVLTHELGHVAHFVLKDRGWTDFANVDVFHSYLYLHGELYRKILTEI